MLLVVAKYDGNSRAFGQGFPLDHDFSVDDDTGSDFHAWHLTTDQQRMTGSEYTELLGLPANPPAREFHDRLKSELWRIDKLGEKPRRTWNEAMVRWLKEESHKATSTGRRQRAALARSLPRQQRPRHHQPHHARHHYGREARAGLQQCNGESDAGVGARDSAQVRQRAAMSFNERVPHSDSFAKYAAALFMISISIFQPRVLGAQPRDLHLLRRDRLALLDVPSLPSAWAFTQLRIDCSGTPISRAILRTGSPPRTRRNDSSLNSSAYAAFGILFIEHLHQPSIIPR